MVGSLVTGGINGVISLLQGGGFWTLTGVGVLVRHEGFGWSEWLEIAEVLGTVEELVIVVVEGNNWYAFGNWWRRTNLFSILSNFWQMSCCCSVMWVRHATIVAWSWQGAAWTLTFLGPVLTQPSCFRARFIAATDTSRLNCSWSNSWRSMEHKGTKLWIQSHLL